MDIYKDELKDGLADKILASQFVTIASAAEPCNKSQLKEDLRDKKP